MTTLDGPAEYLTVQFVACVSEAPRTYGDAMDAWRTSCPRLSIWDDAVRDGLIRMEKGPGPMRQSLVKLTERGRDVLQAGDVVANGAFRSYSRNRESRVK